MTRSAQAISTHMTDFPGKRRKARVAPADTPLSRQMRVRSGGTGGRPNRRQAGRWDGRRPDGALIGPVMPIALPRRTALPE